jgi:hypothetical protein
MHSRKYKLCSQNVSERENLQCIFIAFLTCNFARYIICFQALIAVNVAQRAQRNAIYFMDL